MNVASKPVSSGLWAKIPDEQAVFHDIRIIDLDVAKTTWSRVHESMRVVYLKLDRQPEDSKWMKFFFEERDSRIGTRRHGLWIEDGYISFDCRLDEVETYHLPDIAKSLEFANRRFRQLVEQRNKERDQVRQTAQSEVEQLQALRERLKFNR